MESSELEELDKIIDINCSAVSKNKNLYTINNLCHNINNLFPIVDYNVDNCILILIRLLSDLKYTQYNLDYNTLFILFSILNKYTHYILNYDNFEYDFYVYKKDNVRFLIFSILPNKKNYIIYNLMNDKDDIIMLYHCDNIEDFNVDFKDIKSFNIPRIIVNKNIFKLNNSFSGKFKNIIALLYLCVISIYYHKHCTILNRTNWTNLLEDLYNKFYDSYTNSFFQNNNTFKVPQNININNLKEYYSTIFDKTRKNVTKEQCIQIYLDFLSLT